MHAASLQGNKKKKNASINFRRKLKTIWMTPYEKLFHFKNTILIHALKKQC